MSPIRAKRLLGGAGGPMSPIRAKRPLGGAGGPMSPIRAKRPNRQTEKVDV